MKKNFRKGLINSWTLLKEIFKGFVADRVLKLSAALSYFTLFSIAPMLVVIIGLCSIFLGKEAIEGEVFGMIKNYVGEAPAIQIQEVLIKTTLNYNNIWATVLGGITLLFGATGIFGEIQDSINMIWGLKTKPKKGWILLLFNRMLSFSMVLVLGFVLMVSLMLNALLKTFLDKLNNQLPDQLLEIMIYLDQVLMFITVMILFASIFKVLPDAKIKWRDVLAGAFVTALLFMGGKFLISMYLENNATISAYGATGSIIVLLMWVYYSAIILYFGAEFTQVYAKFRGRRIEPNRYAVFVEDHLIEKPTSSGVDKGSKNIPEG